MQATEVPLSKNAIRVLEARYLRRDAQRRIIETPRELFERVARRVAQAERDAERWAEAFYHQLRALEFLPNSPCLMNAGTALGQLSACFVLPVPDSMAGIFEAVKQMAVIQQSGGGTGFSFSKLRPRGDVVASTGGEASGPVSFMKIFDAATENIKQGGKRRGANMGILRVDHPDIMEFITAKLDEHTLRNFNISVGATDAFMQAAERDEFYGLIHPRTGQRTGQLRAREVFDAIADAAWHTGDPGLIFLDAINRDNPTPHIGAIEATNPCGEIPLLSYEACNLGSINLPRMLRESGSSRSNIDIDWGKLRDTVRVAVRFLDDVIEVNKFPVPEISRMVTGNRKIGLGVMGFAEMLVRLGISYDSGQAIACAERVMKFINDESLAASRDLAEERGVFPNWKGSTHEQRGLRVRNATRTAIAPTGTIGIIAGVSPSIEPLFALVYRRSHVLGGQTLTEINSLFTEYAKRSGTDPEKLAEAMMEKGSLKDVSDAPEKLKHLFVTALEIPAERHLQIQAAFQRHVDNSVSKTINLPKEAAPNDISSAYRRAWELRLKGITIYRYGSKSQQVLELGIGEESQHYDYGSRCDPGECRV
jgi:ribonucleoside-diphosphate reductase alpha chain